MINFVSFLLNMLTELQKKVSLDWSQSLMSFFQVKLIFSKIAILKDV